MIMPNDEFLAASLERNPSAPLVTKFNGSFSYKIQKQLQKEDCS